MKILSIASEVFPLVKTGGLADVAGALPAALAKQGVNVITLMPGYPAVLKALEEFEVAYASDSLFGGAARLLWGKARGLELFVLDAPHLYDRPGNLYLGPDGKDWPDNSRRFAALSLIAAEIGRGSVAEFVPEIIHCHDWQAGLVPAYVRYGGGPKTVMTVHNLAFQGHFPASIFGTLGLPPKAFGIEGVEYFGGVGYLKAGLQCADAITTVSPTYAREILTVEDGMGLDGLLRVRSNVVHGIVNGIDTDIWNPANDTNIAQSYTAKQLAKREANKRAIEKRFGLEPGDGLLYCIVSRLTLQKGMDLVAARFPSSLISAAGLPFWVQVMQHLKDHSRRRRCAIPAGLALRRPMTSRCLISCRRVQMPFSFLHALSPVALRSSMDCTMAACRWWRGWAVWPTQSSMPMMRRFRRGLPLEFNFRQLRRKPWNMRWNALPRFMLIRPHGPPCNRPA